MYAILTIALLAAAPPPLPAQPIDGAMRLRPLGDASTSRIMVEGRAESPCGVPEVVLRIDGREIARARPWLDHSGFEAAIDPLHYAAGEHRVTVLASSPCQPLQVLGESTFEAVRPPPAWFSFGAIALGFAFVFAVAVIMRTWQRRYHALPLWWIVPSLLVFMIATIVAVSHTDPRLKALANWDGAWYLLIAREGYSTDGAYAFFPLFPLLLRMLSILPFSLELWGSIANAALFAGAIRVLQRLLPDQQSGLVAYAALPFSFFFVATYTESLALFLSVAFLFFLRTDRPLYAFLCGYLAGLTRVTSVALLLFGIDALRQKKPRGAAAALGPAAGLATYMLFLRWKTGDPFRFLHTQEHFGRATGFSAGRFIQLVARPFVVEHQWDKVSLLFMALVVLGAALLILDKRLGEGAYCLALLAMPLTTLSLTSIHRYALLAFPAFPILAGYLRNRVVFGLVLGLELYNLFILSRDFAWGHWVG